MGISNCPAEMRSNWAEIPRKGASAAPLTIAARPVEMIRASKTIVPMLDGRQDIVQ